MKRSAGRFSRMMRRFLKARDVEGSTPPPPPDPDPPTPTLSESSSEASGIKASDVNASDVETPGLQAGHRKASDLQVPADPPPRLLRGGVSGSRSAQPGRTPSRRHRPLPVCKAILLCDQVLHDSRTGHHSLIGVRNEFRLKEYPAIVPSVSVFVQLVEGVGQYRITTEMRSLKDNEVVGQSNGFVCNFENRLSMMMVVLILQPMRLREPGHYEFVISANGQRIDSQRFAASLVNPPKEEAA